MPEKIDWAFEIAGWLDSLRNLLLPERAPCLEDVFVAAEMRLPKFVAQHHDGRRTRWWASCRRELERRRHHAHHRVPPSVQLEHAAEDVFVAAEMRLPKFVAQHHHGGRTRFVFFLTKATSQGRLYPQHRKEIGGNDGPGYAFRTIATG